MWYSKIRIVSLAAGTLVFGTITSAAPTKGSSSAPNIVVREYVPDDVFDSDKVWDWMGENDIDEEKLVFYTKEDGQKWASAFASANSGYHYYGSIFGDQFIKDFGEVDTSNEDVAKALSETMADYASGIVRVFNHDPEDGNGPYWELELDLLQKSDDVEWIYQMHAEATDPDDYYDVLKGLDEEEEEEEEEDDSDDEEDEDAEGEEDDGILDGIF